MNKRFCLVIMESVEVHLTPLTKLHLRLYVDVKFKKYHFRTQGLCQPWQTISSLKKKPQSRTNLKNLSLLTIDYLNPEYEDCHSYVEKYINQKSHIRIVHEEQLIESFGSRRRNCNQKVAANNCSEKRMTIVHVWLARDCQLYCNYCNNKVFRVNTFKKRMKSVHEQARDYLRLQCNYCRVTVVHIIGFKNRMIKVHWIEQQTRSI